MLTTARAPATASEPLPFHSGFYPPVPTQALELLDANTIAFAKSVCVSDCPTDFHRCHTDALPCTAPEQYRWGRRPPRAAVKRTASARGPAHPSAPMRASAVHAVRQMHGFAITHYVRSACEHAKTRPALEPPNPRGPGPSRCPYYRFAEKGLYDTLTDANGTAPAAASTDYYGSLASAALVDCNASFLAAANAKARGLGGADKGLYGVAAPAGGIAQGCHFLP
jgi:hypothetical protein